jgi:predicted nucleotidyltransferase
MAIQRTPELVELLVQSKVEFIIIGGVAAIAYGSATFTRDFDICAPLSVENLRRLMVALQAQHPRFALTPNKAPVTQTPEELAAFKNLYLLTDLGRLDVLGQVSGVGGYSTLVSRARNIELHGKRCQIISLDDLIVAKSALGRPKDLQVEKELRAIRERTRKE